MALSGTAASNLAFAISVAALGAGVLLAILAVWQRARRSPARRYVLSSAALFLAGAVAMIYAATPA